MDILTKAQSSPSDKVQGEGFFKAPYRNRPWTGILLWTTGQPTPLSMPEKKSASANEESRSKFFGQ